MTAELTHGQTFEAHVLHLRSYGESDRILQVLSRDQGRLGVIAKGARASKRRFAGILDHFVTLRLHVRPNRGLWRLQAADLVELRPTIRQRWERYVRAHVLCEFAASLSNEGERAPETYQILQHSLDALDAGHLDQAANAYAQFFCQAGITPPLDECLGCKAKRVVVVGIDAERGTVCQRCCQEEPTPESRRLALTGHSFCTAENATPVEALAMTWLEYHLGRPLRVRSLLAN